VPPTGDHIALEGGVGGIGLCTDGIAGAVEAPFAVGGREAIGVRGAGLAGPASDFAFAAALAGRRVADGGVLHNAPRVAATGCADVGIRQKQRGVAEIAIGTGAAQVTHRREAGLA
jgi:hypothetical protein